MELKNILKEKMNKRGLTTKELSEITGINTAQIYSHLKGVIPSQATKKRYAEALDFDINDITYGDDKVNLSVIECSKIIGKGPAVVIRGLIQKDFPFGTAIQMEDGHFEYSIPRKAVEDYMHQSNLTKDLIKIFEMFLQKEKDTHAVGS